MLGFSSRVPWQVSGEKETILECGHGRETEQTEKKTVGRERDQTGRRREPERAREGPFKGLATCDDVTRCSKLNP